MEKKIDKKKYKKAIDLVLVQAEQFSEEWAVN